MSIAREVLGITAAAVGARPVNHSRLAADVAHRCFLTPQLGGHLCFQHRFYHGFHRRGGCGFGVLVDFFQDGLPLMFF